MSRMSCSHLDLTGERFGFLIAIEPIINKHNKTYWRCQCDCGNIKDVRLDNLRSGAIKSCGCSSFADRNKNEYEFTVDTCIGYTNKGEVFLVDIDKYDLIKSYCWHTEPTGYIVSAEGIKLHRLVMDAPDDMFVDHKHGSKTKFDNRSCNLRICTRSQNARNCDTAKNNKLGVKGVSKVGKKYVAKIQFDHNHIHLGTFKTKKEAADAYDEAAKKYFGEFAWLNNYQGND